MFAGTLVLICIQAATCGPFAHIDRSRQRELFSTRSFQGTSEARRATLFDKSTRSKRESPTMFGTKIVIRWIDPEFSQSFCMQDLAGSVKRSPLA
jgi:hypothetical protein